MTELETLTGAVSRVIHRSPSFAVVHVRDEASGKSATVCGTLPPVQPGERIRASGAWEASDKWGQQFRATSATVEHPVTEEGLVECLSKLVDGVGPGIAKKFVAACGGVELALKLLSDPDRLDWEGMPEIVAKMGAARVRKALFYSLRESWQSRQASHELEAGLASLGLTPALRAAVRARYGDDALTVCRTRPYELAMDVEGFGFKRADEVARAAGTPLDSIERKTAALAYALSEDASSRGHVYMTQAQAKRHISSLCGDMFIAEADVTEAATRLVKRGAIVIGEASGAIGLRHLIEAEKAVAAHVQRRAKTEADIAPQLSSIADVTTGLVTEQCAAVELARRRPFLLLTGGPGVGKTTTTKAICALWAAQLGEGNVALCAPTGRAARRLAEATGRPAMTIHRMLGYDPQTSGFVHHAGNRLPFDAVLVDESSMVDIELMRSVLDALRDDCRLVLVGDADQLPPVGPGAPFRDLVLAACCETCGGCGSVPRSISVTGTVYDDCPDCEDGRRLPLARLTQVHRQAQGSRIVGASREVMTARAPTPSLAGDRSEGALFVIEDSRPESLVELVQDDIPSEFGIPSADVQVVAPMRKGAMGVDALNKALQAALNPRPLEECYTYKAGERDLEYRVGDRVMQTRNDYKKGAVNGEIGTVAEMLVHGERDKTAPVLTVRFLEGDGEKVVPYTRKELSHLDLAYCTTVHKVQGAEFRAVVVVCVDAHAHMLERSLLYTALTRAKKLCVLVGSKKAMTRAAKSARSDARRTTLGGLLS